MPTYAYRGTECGHEFETYQSFTDAPLTQCLECSGPVRKVISGVGVTFKGSGFYRNDSRKESRKESRASGAGEKSGSTGGKSGAAGKADKADKPAKSSSGKGDGAGGPSTAKAAASSTK